MTDQSIEQLIRGSLKRNTICSSTSALSDLFFLATMNFFNWDKKNWHEKSEMTPAEGGVGVCKALVGIKVEEP